jgi:hypothetical protein
MVTMKEEEIEQFIDKKKVHLTTVYGNSKNSEPIYYECRIVSVNDSTTTIRDKFDKLVIISNSAIIKVQEL